MTSIYQYRQQAYPDVYEQKPFHPPTIIAQVQQDGYTFRARSIQTPQQEPGRSLQGKPKLSVRSHQSPHHTANASPSQIEMKCQKPAQSARPTMSAVQDLRNMLIYQDELRRARNIKNDNVIRQLADLPPEHLDEAEEEIKHQQTGSGYRYHKPAPINKTQRGKGNAECYKVITDDDTGCVHVMTGGKKETNPNLENAIAMLKANGYTLFKSKLAQGVKRIRKSRAKQKY